MARRDHPRSSRWCTGPRSTSTSASTLNPYTADFSPTKTMTSKSLLVSLACVLAAVQGPTAGGQAHDTAQLRTVVVSATKVPRPAATLSQAVTALSGDDLRARGVVRVSDALREVPGASLVQSGSYGAITSLFLRGGGNPHTQKLIHGVGVKS